MRRKSSEISLRHMRAQTQPRLKEKYALLKNELSKNLQKKRTLELRINEQFEKLKRLETSLEKAGMSYEPNAQYGDSAYERNRRNYDNHCALTPAKIDR
jgi:hypothetical protein